MSAVSASCIELLRSVLDRVDRLPDPSERDRNYGALVAARSRRPMRVAPLSLTAEPTEPSIAPRTVRP